MRRRGSLLLLLAAAGALLVGASASPEPDAASLREKIRTYRKAHELEIVRELASLISHPNVASDHAAIEAAAVETAALLRRRGIATEMLRVEGSPPVIYGELPVPHAARTLILYAHYDGQPVDPAQWAGGDPWRPVLRDKPLEQGGREIRWDSVHAPLDPEWRLYGRSASDDRAPIVGLLAALDALRSAEIPPTVNLKFFLEGEEEAGSPHLEAILGKYAPRLKGDLWLLFDGPVHQTRRMQVFFGARGITDVELTTYGALRRLHSGHYGNWAPNPIAELAALLAGMRDDEGRIRISGFDDDVRPLTPTERKALAEVPEVEGELRKELALGRTEGSESLVESIQRPALNLRGVSGGDVGSRSTNSIPTEATASIDFRLVPDQTPDRVRRRVEEHLRRLGYRIVSEPPDRQTRLSSPRIVRLRWGAGYPAARTPMDLLVSRLLLQVLDESNGSPVIRLPSLGGSIPMYLFSEKLATPVIGVPIVNHDNNQHAANENLRLQNLWDGIEIYAAIMVRMGQEWR